MIPCPLGLEVPVYITGGLCSRLRCGNRVRHGSEQPYHRLPMLEGLTGLMNADG